MSHLGIHGIHKIPVSKPSDPGMRTATVTSGVTGTSQSMWFLPGGGTPKCNWRLAYPNGGEIRLI